MADAVVGGRRRRRLRLAIGVGLAAVMVLAAWITARAVGSSTGPFTVVFTDDFTGSGIDTTNWDVYSGSSTGQHWDPANCVVGGGLLTIQAQSDGRTCGIASHLNLTFGAFEARAKFDAPAAPEFDTTFIAWPQDDSAWQDAEIDYVEEQDPARQSITGFVHCSGCPEGQLAAGPAPLDMTQWHTYRLEWTPSSIRFLVDGTPWFTTTDRSVISALPHHATLQTNYDDDGKTPTRTTTEVDWVKVYRYNSGQ